MSRDSVARAHAAVQAARDGTPDDARAAALVSLLDDRDPGVRMYAILSLRRIYGDDLGYRYYAPESERSAAIERWRGALRDGTIKTAAVPDTSGAPADAPPVPAYSPADPAPRSPT